MNIKNLNKYLPTLLPKSNIFSSFIIFLGFISPFPIFIKTNSLYPLFIDFNYEKMTVDPGDGLPIPIGVFSISFYLFLVVIRTKSSFYLIKNILLAVLILFPVLRGFDLLRIPILVAPILFFVTIIRFLKVRYTPKDGFAIGYILGLLAVYIINIFSFLFLSIVSGSPFDIQYARQIFGYEIWQYYVTYSSVASIAFGTITLYLINNYKFVFKIKTILISLSFLSLIASILPLRKAAFLDILVVAFLISYQSILDILKLKINKIRLVILAITTVSIVFGIFYAIEQRDLTITSSLEDRIGPILMAIDVINLNIYEIVFGFESGFGGYSNLVVELIIRNGILGLSIYLLLIGYFARKYFVTLKNYPGLSRFKNQNIIIFILLSTLVGNLVNLNFATPYFVVNFAAIIITFNNLDLISRIRLKPLISLKKLT